MATIATYGETLHTFVERNGYEGAFLPGYAPPRSPAHDAGMFVGIDHVVGNVELGRLDEWVGYYERVFGMTEMIHFTDRDISTEYSALMSKVMADGKGRVKFPINEPAEGQRKSQIEEYLEYYGGPGAQHIALATTDIVATVRELQRARNSLHQDARRATTRSFPAGSARSTRTSPTCASSGILADRDDEGYLLQIFSQTIGDRPTVFLEVIERHGARGFGEGNFKALFEAIEREQDAAGTLTTSDERRAKMRYHSLGEIPAKRHVAIRGNNGSAACWSRRSWATRASPATSRSSTTSSRRAGSPRLASSGRSSTRSGSPRRTSTATSQRRDRARRRPDRAAGAA